MQFISPLNKKDFCIFSNILFLCNTKSKNMKLFKLIEKVKSNYKKLLLDFISAFLGVLIALLLNNWKEERKENAFISKSIESIYYDNKTNIENISWQIDHLKNQCDTIFLSLQDDQLSVIDVIRKNNGLETVNIIQTGWEILINSQLANKMDYELLTQLTFISSNIVLIENNKNSITEILYKSLESNNTNDKYRLYIILKDLLRMSERFKENAENLNHSIYLKYGKELKLTN